MRLKTFGGLAVINSDGHADEIRIQRRQLAVLCVLAAESSASVSRERLISLLWADTEEGKARHALDQVLYAVRRALGAEVIVSGATALQLDSTVLPSDAAEFDAALKRGDLETATTVYSGPFLEAVSLTDIPDFEQWVDGRRRHYADAFAQALRQLASAATARRDFALAVTHLRRAAASDPLSSAVTHDLMSALVNSGNAGAALAAGRVHCALVREQLEVEPDSAILSLMESVRTGDVRQPAAVAASSSGAAMAPPPSVGTGTSRTGGEHVATPAARPPGGIPLRRALSLVLGVAVLALLGARLVRGRSRTLPVSVLLRDRSQITTSGKITQPAVTADGKYVAFVSTTCGDAGCTYAVDIQEVGGTVTRRILDQAKGIYYIAWSPDSKNLLVAGTLAGGTAGFQKLYLISALGGQPLPLCQCSGGFFSGGDSLVLAPGPAPDGESVIYFTALDGLPRDSIRVRGLAGGINYVLNVPGTRWLVVDINHAPGSELRVIDRTGREFARQLTPWIDNYAMADDAVWLSLRRGTDFTLVRLPFDTASGRLSTVPDTMYTGAFTAFSVTQDGSRLVLDEGTEEYNLQSLPFSDALRGKFTGARQLVTGSSSVGFAIAPDGRHVLISRERSRAEEYALRLSVMPFEGGAEVPVPVAGEPWNWGWADAATLALGVRTSTGNELVRVNVATRAPSDEFALADSAHCCHMSPIRGGGWAWIPEDGQSVRVQRLGGTARDVFPKPPWFTYLNGVGVEGDGLRLLYTGANVSFDSVRIEVVSLADGREQAWATLPAGEGLDAGWLDDGSILVEKYGTPETRTFFRLRSPGRLDSLGTILRPVFGVEVSPDLKRAVVSTRLYHGDAWMYRVQRPQ